MPVPQPRYSPSEKISDSNGRGAAVATALQRDGEPDEPAVLSTLRDLVAAGEHRLDPMLAAIADAALMLTGATGVALAMWKDGAMVCRARSGETAPPLGARLSADTGISGLCLRTGKTQHCVDTEVDRLVDREVCRTLGLRSIAVLPIHGERGNNGILEAFSTEPKAFTPHHLAVLEHLAALAERARAAKPVGASPAAAPVVVKAPVEKPAHSGLLPASDRFVDFVQVLVGRRPLVLGAVGLAVAALLGLMIWLGWRGSDGNESRAHAAAPIAIAVNTVASAGAQEAKSSNSGIAGQHLPDNDAVWKPNPGGQLLAASGKPSAARSVKGAAELDAAETRKNKNKGAGVATGTATGAGGSEPAESKATDRAVTSGSGPSAAADLGLAKPVRNPAKNKEEVAALEPPPLIAGQGSPALSGVLSSEGALPTLSQQRVSRGISGGQLIHRVPPVYPLQAKSLRMEGKVVLDAMVMEDGRLSDLKVVQGEPIFTGAAMEAVKKWRYKPFLLDGKTVKSPMRITVDFKLP